MSKLSFHDLAPIALTCRQFGVEYLARVAEERERLLSAAEETFGKGMVSGFVEAFQRILFGLAPFPGLPLDGIPRRVIIDSAGRPGVLPAIKESWDKLLTNGERIGVFGGFTGSQQFAHIYQAGPVICIQSIRLMLSSNFWVNVRSSSEAGIYLSACVERKDATAGMGLLLAICTRNPEAMPACWRGPLSKATLQKGGCDLEWEPEAEAPIGAFGSPTPSTLSPFYVKDPENPERFKLLRIGW